MSRNIRNRSGPVLKAGIALIISLLLGWRFVAFAATNEAIDPGGGGLSLLPSGTVTVDALPAGSAVTSAIAEIDPNSVAISSAGNLFTYDVLPTINVSDTGVDQVIIAVPAGYGALSVTSVLVGGVVQSSDCALNNANEYCAAVAGQIITITLRDKVTVSGTNIRISFNANAPSSTGSALFTSTVDDTSTAGIPAQSTVEGDADADAGDNNSLTVLVTGSGVASALAEITPSSVEVGSSGNVFTYTILPTINAGNSGINEIVLTVPQGYASMAVTGVTTHAAARTASCVLNPGEYCASVAGQIMTITLGTPVVDTDVDKRIIIVFTADAPVAKGSADFISTVNDNATANAAQTTSAGNANGISGDSDSITVVVRGDAVTAVIAEIDPNNVVLSSTGNTFTYDILPEINTGDTGIDRIDITVPADYTNAGVSAVSIAGAPLTLNCPTPGSGEYCVSVTGQILTITMGSLVTTTGTGISIELNADAPLVPGSADFTATVDDTSTAAFSAQAIVPGDADGDANDGNSITVDVVGNAVTSANAEIMPHEVAIRSVGNVFTYFVRPEINPGDTGVNRIEITTPAGYANLAVTSVSVASAGQAAARKVPGAPQTVSCPNPGSGQYCATVSGQTVTILFGAKISASMTGTLITFSADAPSTPGTADFTSTVDDGATANAAQQTVAGDADGNGSNGNSLSVRATGDAVTSAAAEISPNTVAINSTENVFTYDVLPEINTGDTGVDNIVITVPGGYTNIGVTDMVVGGTSQTLNCPVPGAGEYCPAVSGQTISIQLGTKVIATATNMRVVFSADAPDTAGSADFASLVDDLSTVNIPQSTAPGDADGDSSDQNSISVTVVYTADPNLSTLVVDPQIVLADGIEYSTVTATLYDFASRPLSDRTVELSTDRTGMDSITQPASPSDVNGMASGTVRSASPGVSVVSATVISDGVTLAARPEIYFTQGMVLEIAKSANKDEAVVGDVVTYLVEIRNTTANDVVLVRVDDRIPPNFKYRKGTARLNGSPLADPVGNRTLTFDVGTVPALVDDNANGKADPGEQGYMTLAYQLIIGSGATPNEYVNTAVAKDVCDLCLISNEDDAKVTVTFDPIFDLGTIIGKVFKDKDGDGWQDEGEEGIGGAMVALDNGTYALTDEYGRYHFPAVAPGHRLVKINLAELPSAATTTTDEAKVVSVTPGLLAKANFGISYLQNEEKIGRPRELGVRLTSDDDTDPVQVIGSIETLAVLINGQMVDLPYNDIHLRAKGIDDVIKITGDRLNEPVLFSLAVRSPELVSEWNVTIYDNNGDPVRVIKGEGAPPEKIEWDGRTGADELVTGGEVYQYQVQAVYQDGTISYSGRRLLGVNKTSVVSLDLRSKAFANGSTDLNGDAYAQLSDIAEVLKQYPDEKILIEGYSDSQGPAKMNLDLSKKRAEVTRDYLVKEFGMDRERFIVKWYGEKRPIADNNTPEGREANRRVEIKGEFKEADTTVLRDQYRTEPLARINGSDAPIDEDGRFAIDIHPDDREEIDIHLISEQGHHIEAKVIMPAVEILQPIETFVLPYGAESDNYMVNSKDGEGWKYQKEIALVYRMKGRTEPGNQVYIDENVLEIDNKGNFTADLQLLIGENTFGILVVSPEGYSRILNLHITVADREENGEYIIATKPVPYLSVNLPPEGMTLRNKEFTISGKTDPVNKVSINSVPVELAPDGNFSHTLNFEYGINDIELNVVDPEGFDGTISREVTVSDTVLFFMAFADGKVGQLQGKGYLQGAGMDDSKEYYSEGRVAYYLKGVIAGKYIITSAFDTGTDEFDTMFSDLDKGQNDRLLTNIDPDKIYPVYGDSSTVVYDSQSQGKFYLALDSDELHALVGNYQLTMSDTELAGYNRTLYGGQVRYQSVSRTEYGQPETQVVVFGAEVRQAHIRDEMKATGGSLYYLSHKDVIEGSEQVTLVVRDSDTGLLINRVPQEVNVDYTIKYEEGRILFNRPVSSVVEDSGIIDQALLAGNPVYIEIDYEIEVPSFEKSAYGGRVKQQVGDHLAVGGTYVRDELASGRYEMTGMDTEVRFGKNSRIIGEYAESSGVDSQLYVSEDGGLSFNEETPNGVLEGNAWKAAAELDVGEWFGISNRFMIGGYYKRLQSGFMTGGNFMERGTEKTGLNMHLKLSKKDSLLARYDTEDMESSATTGSQKSDSATVQLVHNEDWWGIDGELQTREQTGADRSSYGALRLRLALTEKLTSYVQHQQTLEGEEQNRSTIGLEYQLLESLKVQGSVASGTGGQAAEAGAVLSLGEKRVYLTERVIEENADRSTATILGAEAPLGERSRMYTEYQWEHAEDSNRNVSLLGAQKEWTVVDGLRFLLTGEFTSVDSTASAGERYTVSSGLLYADPSGLAASTRNEVRRETGTNNRVQYLTINNLEFKLNQDLSMLGKYRYSVTRDLRLDRDEAQFEERSIGLAYRPVRHDRFNALTRYTHLTDQRPAGTGLLSSMTTVKDVASLEWSFDINRYIEWVEKGAMKVQTEETASMPDATTHTYLNINRMNLNVWKKIAVGLEYRMLIQHEADDRREGWLTEIMWEAVKNIRLGVGYNFTDFSDNEFSDNNYSVQGWFFRLQAKY